MSRRYCAVLLLSLAACGEEDSLSCEWLDGPDNCYRSELAAMYTCVGLSTRPDPASGTGVIEYYIEGKFSADGKECVDDSGTKKVVFSTPVDFANLPGIVYDSSFSMYRGTTLCGTVERSTRDGTLTLTTSNGAVFYEQGPTEQALTCQDGTRRTGDLKAQACYPSRPHGNGVHVNGAAGLRLFQGAGLTIDSKGFTFHCTVP